MAKITYDQDAERRMIQSLPPDILVRFRMVMDQYLAICQNAKSPPGVNRTGL